MQARSLANHIARRKACRDRHARLTNLSLRDSRRVKRATQRDPYWRLNTRRGKRFRPLIRFLKILNSNHVLIIGCSIAREF